MGNKVFALFTNNFRVTSRLANISNNVRALKKGPIFQQLAPLTFFTEENKMAGLQNNWRQISRLFSTARQLRAIESKAASAGEHGKVQNSIFVLNHFLF